MKKIILDCDLMKFPNSGLYHYCLNLGQYVLRLLADEAMAKISFYVPPAEANTFGPDARTIVERNRRWNFFRRPVFGECDVWHAPFQSGRILPDKNRHPRVKVLLTIHDLNALHEGKPLDEQRKSIAHTQSLIDRSDAIVCISEFTRQDVLKNCNVGKRPVYVIHNGTHQVHPPMLKADSYKPTRPFLFGMGYVNRKKNYKVLLPLLKDESIEMIIAGRLDEPDYVESMRDEAAKMGVSDRLYIPGPISEGEKGWYFRNCMAFVHPSLAEGFGAPVVEAMQLGKPLFLSSLTSLPEIGGDAAFYFSSFESEHVRDVFHKGMAAYGGGAMAERIRQRGLSFSWNEKAKEYLQVYQSLF